MPDPREHIWPNTFLKYHAIYPFWPSLSMVKNHFKKLSDPDSDSDLHQNWSSSSLLHIQCVHQFSSESVHNFLRYRAIYHFGPVSQWWRNTEKILVVRSGSRSSPKSNQFVLVKHRTCPQNFIRICPQLFEISCTQTDRQTDRKGWKHNLLHLRWRR